MPDGTLPTPGGWNRFAIEVTDLEKMVERLRKSGARFGTTSSRASAASRSSSRIHPATRSSSSSPCWRRPSSVPPERLVGHRLYSVPPRCRW